VKAAASYFLEDSLTTWEARRYLLRLKAAFGEKKEMILSDTFMG
jgi:hypothetical protein